MRGSRSALFSIAGPMLVMCWFNDARAQDGDHAARPVVRALRLEQAVQVDGRLNEAVWRTPPVATEFTQRNPAEGEPATERTDVWIAYDVNAIYIAARMHDRRPVSARLGRRDSSLPGSDWFSVTFDSYHDHLSAYQFSVNPAGVRRDIRVSATNDEDETWDPVWEAAAHSDSAGWQVEISVPLSQLRFRAEDEQTWGIQLVREISRNAEESWFAFTAKRERAGVARYAHLLGLNGLRPSSPLELLPYGLTRATYRNVPRSADVTFLNPFTDGSDYTTSAGLDLKYRVASNLTLDATINPDFGQVEADPAVINLSAFETRFDERRPFFIEGSDVFSFGDGFGDTQLFYSRRIGGPPPGRLPSITVYDDMPDHSTILGAAKLTGKIGGWSLGVLEAVTARERANYITEDETRASSIVATPTNYFVSRARRELRGGSSVIGGIATALHRSLEDDAIAQRVRSNAYAGGIDFRHEWADRSWSLTGFLTGSHILGRAGVITAAQQSSARYFQRPDADHLTLDARARSLSGLAGDIELSKEAGEHWRGEASFSTTSPGYETNDLGFQSRADQHNARVSVQYVNEEPGRFLREWNIDVSSSAEWNYGGNRLGSRIELESSAELLNYWTGDLEMSRDFGGLDDRLTRGGPLTRAPALNNLSVSIESDSRKAWTIDAGIDREWGGIGRSTSVDIELGFKPAPNWNVSITPEWGRDRVRAQFVDAIADPLATATYQRRYVFADLVETEFSVAINANVTFTPDLTLSVFARPFIGSGKFGRPKELIAPRTFRFAHYDEIGTVEDLGDELEIDPDGAGPAQSFEIDQENFVVRSLRGNAVLRWEWRPGSTLFLVWQQQREREIDQLSTLRFGRDLRALARIRPENVFMIKLSYWLNP